MKIKLFWLALIVLTVFTRFWHLDLTARFIWDESSDLVKIHQYWVEKRISLIGPVSEDGLKVFSSLSYYLVFPFVILWNFDPVGPVIGTAFWGTVSLFLWLLYLKSTNRLINLINFVFLLFWTPFLTVSRWAWNPHLAPLWMAVSLLLARRNTWLFSLLAGFSAGLMVHHHFLFFPVSVLLALSFPKKFWALTGLFIALLPFGLFDLTHPPGLFITRFMYSDLTHQSFNLATFMGRILTNFRIFGDYVIGLPGYWWVVIFPSWALWLHDRWHRRSDLLISFTWLLQPVFLSLLPAANGYYFLASAFGWLVWLVHKRQAKIILGLLACINLVTLPGLLTTRSWQTDIPLVRDVTAIIRSAGYPSANLAVLASPDPNTYGRRYRDMLLLQGIVVPAKETYFDSPYLLVLSTSSETIVRNDAAAEMHPFRSGRLINHWASLSGWKIYLFAKNNP